MNTRLIYLTATICILCIGFVSCNSENPDSEGMLNSNVVTNPNTADTGGKKGVLPELTFEETEHNFGRVIEGETVSFSFRFTNTGDSDLIIADVTASCGCTIPSYPKTAIRPGEEGVVKIAFNSRGRKGFQTKSMVVVANTQPNVTQLKIKAEVVAPGE